MPEKTKHIEGENGESPADDSLWSEDQAKRGYYYDDAYGYEKFVDDDEPDELSGGGRPDVDLDRPPALLVEPQDAEQEPGEVSCEDGDPDV